MGNLLSLPFPMRTPPPCLSPKLPSVPVFLWGARSPWCAHHIPLRTPPPRSQSREAAPSCHPCLLKTLRLSSGAHWVGSGLLPVHPPSRALCKAYLDCRSPLRSPPISLPVAAFPSPGGALDLSLHAWDWLPCPCAVVAPGQHAGDHLSVSWPRCTPGGQAWGGSEQLHRHVGQGFRKQSSLQHSTDHSKTIVTVPPGRAV